MGHMLSELDIPVLVIQEGGYSKDEILGPCAQNFIKGLSHNPF